MRSKPYDDERVAALLRCLRPAPAAWVARAKRVALGPLTDADLAELTQKLELEPAFKERFEDDPVAATETAGFRRLAAHLQRELEEFLATPEEWLASVPEVVAHGPGGVPPEARLRMLLVATKMVARAFGRDDAG